MLRIAQLSILILFISSFVLGCSSYSKTVRSDTVEYPTESGYAATDTYGGYARTDQPVVERRTEETTTETKGESTGLLSGTVHVVGQALALPFRAVGGLISVIF